MSQESKKNFQEVVLKKLQLAVRALPINREHVQDCLNILELKTSTEFREAMFVVIMVEVSAITHRNDPRNTDRFTDLMDTLWQSEMQARDAHELALVLSNMPEFLRGLGMNTLAKHAEDVLTDLRGREDKKPAVQENPIWGR